MRPIGLILLIPFLVACHPKKEGETAEPEGTDYTLYDGDRNGRVDVSVGPYDATGAPGILVDYGEGSTVLTSPFEGGDLAEAPKLSWALNYRCEWDLLPDVTGDFLPEVSFGWVDSWHLYAGPLEGKNEADYIAFVELTGRLREYSIAPADFNGDGLMDIADSQGVLLGPIESSSRDIQLVIDEEHTFASAGDLDGDGLANLVLSRWETLLLDDGLPVGDVLASDFEIATWSFGGGVEPLADADLTGDGVNDLVISTIRMESVSSSEESPITHVVVPSTSRSEDLDEVEGFHFVSEEGGHEEGRLTTGDFDGDGQVDLAIAIIQYTPHTMVFPGPLLPGVYGEGDAALILEPSGDIPPAEHFDEFCRDGPWQFGISLDAADLDADGRDDLVIRDSTGTSGSFYCSTFPALYIAWGGGL